MFMKWLRNKIDEMVRQSLDKQQVKVDWASPVKPLREPKRIFIPKEHIEDILRLRDEGEVSPYRALPHHRMWAHILEVLDADPRIAWTLRVGGPFPCIEENIGESVVVPPDYEHKEKPEVVEVKVHVDSAEAEATIGRMAASVQDLVDKISSVTEKSPEALKGGDAMK